MRFLVHDGMRKYQAHINRFPAGELGIVLPPDLPQHISSITIYYDWVEYKDAGIMLIAQLLNALNAKYRGSKYHKTLLLPYVPYSRQDRVCREGESFSLQSFSWLINQMEFDHVITWDNHSHVSTALINNCEDIPQDQLIDSSLLRDERGVNIVSPDAGAAKKIYGVANVLTSSFIVHCDKKRVISGDIIGVNIHNEDVVKNSQRLLVVDDLCDGGATFIHIAKQIKDINPYVILSLYVTHGFFTKGLEDLLRFYNRIYTTDSVCRIDHPQLKIIKRLQHV